MNVNLWTTGPLRLQWSMVNLYMNRLLYKQKERAKERALFACTAVLREAWARLPESSSRPLQATLAQSRNLAHASLETAVSQFLTMSCEAFI